MKFKEYAKNNEYVFIDDRFEAISDLECEEFEPTDDVCKADLVEKPELDFGDIYSVLDNAEYSTDEQDPDDFIIKNKEALAKINKILKEEIIIGGIYRAGDRLELDDADRKEIFRKESE